MLEPYAGKLACTVLREERGREAPDLPDASDNPILEKVKIDFWGTVYDNKAVPVNPASKPTER